MHLNYCRKDRKLHIELTRTCICKFAFFIAIDHSNSCLTPRKSVHWLFSCPTMTRREAFVQYSRVADCPARQSGTIGYPAATRQAPTYERNRCVSLPRSKSSAERASRTPWVALPLTKWRNQANTVDRQSKSVDIVRSPPAPSPQHLECPFVLLFQGPEPERADAPLSRPPR
jgi:hypothetical protein